MSSRHMGQALSITAIAGVILAMIAATPAGATRIAADEPTPTPTPTIVVEPDPEPSVEPSATEVPSPGSCVVGPMADCAGVSWAGRNLRGADLSGANFEEAILDNADLSEASVRGATLNKASMAFAQLEHANLSDATAISTSFLSASLRASDADGLDASWAELTSADFSDAVLTDATLAKVTAIQASFVRAHMAHAILDGSNLTGVDLSGAELTDASLVGAVLTGGIVDEDTDFTGADLSGATWVDGRRCLAGSVGKCRKAVNAVQPPEAGAGSIISAVVKAGAAAYKYASECQKNLDAGGKCFDSEVTREVNAVRGDIAKVQKQIQQNAEQTNSAFNKVLQKFQEARVLADFKQVESDLDRTRAVTRKYQEFLNCLAWLNHDGDVKCVTTDIDGNGPVEITDPAKVWEGSNWPLVKMSRGGPIARLMYASLYRMGGESNYDPQKLVDTGRRMMKTLAGVKYPVSTGLLKAHWDLIEADLNDAYRARAGAKTRYIPGRATLQMNALTQYYTNLEAEYFAGTLAALQLYSPQEDSAQEVRSLLDLAANGSEVVGKDLGLDAQVNNYSFPLDDFAEANPNRVAFFSTGTGPNARVLRVQQGFPSQTATLPASVYVDRPDFPFPSYGTLQEFQDALAAWGVPMSKVQGMDAQVFPSGWRDATWWAVYGDQYKSFNVRDKRWNPWTFEDVVFRSSSAAPDYGFWGDNVATRTYSRCIMPVRMQDGKPTMAQAFEENRKSDVSLSGNRDWSRVMSQVYKDGTKKKTMYWLYSQAERNYNAVVRNGAVPAYDVGYTFREGKSGDDPQGVGMWYRCSGAYNSYIARPLLTDYESFLQLKAVDGAFRLFTSAAVAQEAANEDND